MPGEVARGLDHHALQAQADAERRDLVRRARSVSAPSLPSIPRTPKPPGTSTPSTSAERAAAPAGVSQSSEATQRMLHLGVVGEPTGAQRLGDREVGVGQVDVLADQGDRDLARWVVHPLQQLVPVGPVDVAERQARAGVRRRRRGPRRAAPSGCRRSRARRPRDTTASLSTSHMLRDLALDAVGDRPVGAAHDRVGRDADGAQRLHASAASAWS